VPVVSARGGFEARAACTEDCLPHAVELLVAQVELKALIGVGARVEGQPVVRAVQDTGLRIHYYMS